MAKSDGKAKPGKDEHFMALALEEARRSLGCTSPNPAVGAVIVKDGMVLAKGRHRRAGEPHAEVDAIRALEKEAGSRAAALLRGASIYVTLEPCSTQGRTPPCTEAILEAGFKRVVFGAADPNPAHRGRAARALRRRGVEVGSGILRDECRHLIRGFEKLILTKIPYVIAKSALTLDGRITQPPDGGRWITGREARADVQRLRSEVDAILVGGETLRRDNPRLTLRGEWARKGRPQPWRVIQTRRGRLPRNSHVFNDKHKARTLVFKGKSLRSILRDLGRREVSLVLLEAGGNVLGQALKAGLVDEAHFYFAPQIGGGSKRAVDGDGFACRLEEMTLTPVGDDFKVVGYPNKPTQKGRSKR